MLFSISFTIDVGIGAYFVYYKYMNRNKETVVNESFHYDTIFDYWTYKMTADAKYISFKIRNITFSVT